MGCEENIFVDRGDGVKKVKVYVQPEVLTHSLSVLSPRLYSLLCSDELGSGLGFEQVPWSGTLAGIPRAGEPVVVCAAMVMHCGWQELAELCQRRGHFLVYQSGLVSMDGRVDFEFAPFYEAYKMFMERFCERHSNQGEERR